MGIPPPDENGVYYEVEALVHIAQLQIQPDVNCEDQVSDPVEYPKRGEPVGGIKITQERYSDGDLNELSHDEHYD
jgi:hypothetical protein